MERRAGLVIFALSLGLGTLGAQVSPPSSPDAPDHGEHPPFDKPPGLRKRLDPDGEKRNDPEMMQRLLELSGKSKEELTDELQKWPRFQKMSLEEQGKLMIRLEEMKRRGREEAERKAQEMGLELKPEQMDAFAKSFWQKRFAMMKKLKEEMEPLRRKLQEQMNAELKQEFGNK